MNVRLYDGPIGLPVMTGADLVPANEEKKDISLKRCGDLVMEIEGKEAYVYDTNVNLSRRWDREYLPALSRTPVAYFDFSGEGEVQVRITRKEGFSSATVSPSAFGIIPEVSTVKKRVEFMIREPGAYTVQFDGKAERAIHIFANPAESEIPDEKEEGVIYIGPGEHDMGDIRLHDHETLYIAGGAVVYGTVTAEGAKDVKVCGRGILDGSKYAGWKAKDSHVPLRFDHCKNVTVEDVIVLNPNAWVCQGFDTVNMSVTNVKIISCRPNGDGITLQSCQDVLVDGCFVRSWDDSLVVKNYLGNTENIRFYNTQIWTDFAQSMEIGYETNKGRKDDSQISEVIFQNICVLHGYHKPVISIHNADEAEVSDIVFRDIVIEDSQVGSGDGEVMPYLIDFCILENGEWSSTKRRGTIHDITVSDVKVLGGKFNVSRIAGFDQDHKVTDVTIRNLEILGEKITDSITGKFQIDERTTGNVKIE